MDIDEFLDKELVEEKEKQVKEDASQPKENTAETKEETNIKHFLELWKKISEAKFKWDLRLYNELSETGEKARQEFYKASVNVDREKKAIKRLIGKVLDETEKKNYEEATKLYSEIKEMQNKIPDFMMEEKKGLNREIFLLYQKMHEGMDRKFVNDFRLVVDKINTLIRDSFMSLNADDLEKAKVLYEKVIEEYKALPNGFMEKKLELGENILKLYKDISIQTQINELQQQLSGGDYKGFDSYNRLKELTQSVESTQEKKPLHEAIHQSFKLKPDVHIPERMLLNRLISRKLERARINIKKSLYAEAKRNLTAVLRVDPENNEAKKILNSIPPHKVLI